MESGNEFEKEFPHGVIQQLRLDISRKDSEIYALEKDLINRNKELSEVVQKNEVIQSKLAESYDLQDGMNKKIKELENELEKKQGRIEDLKESESYRNEKLEAQNARYREALKYFASYEVPENFRELPFHAGIDMGEAILKAKEVLQASGSPDQIVNANKTIDFRNNKEECDHPLVQFSLCMVCRKRVTQIEYEVSPDGKGEVK